MDQLEFVPAAGGVRESNRDGDVLHMNASTQGLFVVETDRLSSTFSVTVTSITGSPVQSILDGFLPMECT